MSTNESQEWAVVRLVTVQKKGEMGRLLFTTITELAKGRPVPTSMVGAEPFDLKANEEKLYFRRTLLSKEEAVKWFRSLGEGERYTPIPTREKDREKLDGIPIRVSRLDDVQLWPALGLPITEELFSGPDKRSIDPAPFIGSVPGRLHRRFGSPDGLKGFLKNRGAQQFVARRLHIDLFEYQEYLGGAVYIAPDPVVRQIDNFMVPASETQGERIIYRIVPRLGQTLEKLRITAFDKEAQLLSSVETYQVPADGILEVDKGICMGEYGFVMTHESEGVLAYQPAAPFLRQMNLSIRASSGNKSNKVRVPSSGARDSSFMEYNAAMGSELVSSSVLGEVSDPGAGMRVATEARKRAKIVDAKNAGQTWFPEGSRDEAAHFIRDLLRAARFRVVIADPYLGALQLGQFLYVLHGSEVNVVLLTTKLAFKSKSKSSINKTKLGLLQGFKASLEKLTKLQKLTPEVKIISENSMHDRFMVVDDDVWFLGNSLNSLGEKASMIVKLPYPDEVIGQLEALAVQSPNLDTYISKVSSAGCEPGADEKF